MADVLSLAFVDHHAMNHRETSHRQTYMHHPKTSQGSLRDLEEVRDDCFLGSLNSTSSKEVDTRPAEIHERAVDGLKQFIGVPVTSVQTLYKLHFKPMHAPKMQSDRFWKDNKEEEDISAASSDRMAYAHDLASMRSGGVVRSETFGVSSTSILQSVPSEVLELICKRLSPFNLCSLCQVSEMSVSSAANCTSLIRRCGSEHLQETRTFSLLDLRTVDSPDEEVRYNELSNWYTTITQS